jgi:signal peptidase
MKRRQFIALIVGAVVLAAFAIIVSGILPYRVYIVHTGSMEPTIFSRSAVLVQQHVYRVGQPISFYEQGGVITHRLVRVNADGTAVTKGDANQTADPWTIKISAIIGGVIASPPEAGYWLMYLKSPFGLASILLSAIVCWQLFSLSEHTGDPVHAKRGKIADEPADTDPEPATSDDGLQRIRRPAATNHDSGLASTRAIFDSSSGSQ